MKFSISIAAALLAIYSLFLQFGPQPKNVRIQSQWQENRYVLERYFRYSSLNSNQHPKIVVAGSSLSERLDLSNFGQCVYNIALSGESMMTGVAAVVASGQRPAQLFIETNIASRKINRDLIEKADSYLPKKISIFRTENMPINKIFSFLASGTKSPKASNVKPAVFNNALQSKKDAYQKLIPPEILAANLNDLRTLITAIKKNGTEVIFFEMPINPEIENFPQIVQVRTAFQEKFIDFRKVSYENLAIGRSIHTVDGIHLDSDEAKSASLQLGTQFRLKCTQNSDQ